jgi:undecaprenyl phosphate N,N'-diacetylbacillosamine 1-phosphate transferase
MYKRIWKSVFDFIIAFIAALILLPIFILIALAIIIDSAGPVLFRQKRIGRNGQVFDIYKFRSMVSDQSKFKKTKEVYSDDPRITRVGSFIRKTSLDELPQIINILKGEMSFIGPRPPLPHFPKKYEEYNEFEKQRFAVKPGISGLAQVRCREIHDWDINIPIDVEYVNNYSFIYDLELFMASLLAFFRTENIYRKEPPSNRTVKK